MPFKAAYDFIDQVTVFDTPSVDVVVAVNNVLACFQLSVEKYHSDCVYYQVQQ